MKLADNLIAAGVILCFVALCADNEDMSISALLIQKIAAIVCGAGLVLLYRWIHSKKISKRY